MAPSLAPTLASTLVLRQVRRLILLDTDVVVLGVRARAGDNPSLSPKPTLTLAASYPYHYP